MTALGRMMALMALALAWGCSDNPGTTLAGLGEPCLAEGDCQVGLMCDNGVCAQAPLPCGPEGECPEGLVCLDDLCVTLPPPDCFIDEDCAPDGWCDQGVCLPILCLGDEECAPDMMCLEGDCVPAPECTLDQECDGLRRCDGGICVYMGPCQGDEDCGEGRRCQEEACVVVEACRIDGDCGAGRRCDDGICVPDRCTTSDDCGEGLRCHEGECIALVCRLDADCLEGEICRLGQCTVAPSCQNEGDCQGGEICLFDHCQGCLLDEDCGPDRVCSSIGRCTSSANQPPVADAGPDQQVAVGAEVSLDGRASADPEGEEITYLWRLLEGADIELTGASTATPSLRAPTQSVELVLGLVVSDGLMESAEDRVRVLVTNQPPLADAGPDQFVDPGDEVTLSGRGSRDPEGLPLTYQWAQVGGGELELTGPQTATPSFTAPQNLEPLVFRLVVSDGEYTSTADEVTVYLGNPPPMADAGPDQVVLPGSVVVLDGSASLDPEGEAITYAWSHVSGAEVTLDDPTSPTPSFVAPQEAGELVFALVVSDGVLSSEADEVVIRVSPEATNLPPVAHAGDDMSVLPGQLVILDGSASQDPEGFTITYTWAQTEGAEVALSDLQIARPSFTAPGPGELVFTLVVSDGVSASEADEVVVTITNQRPVAVAGEDMDVAPGSLVRLDGSASHDPDGQTLTYLWTQVGGDAVELTGAYEAMASFTAPAMAAELTFALVVNDGVEPSRPDQIIVIVPGSAPVAVAGADQAALPGDTVRLDGTGSHDDDGDSITYSWVQTAGTTVSLSNATNARPVFTAPAPRGELTFSLKVSDGLFTSDSDEVTVTIGNIAPVAEGGPDQSVQLGAQVDLDGTASWDENGDTLTYSWRRVSGPLIAIDDLGNGLATFAAPMNRSTVVIALVVSDGLESSEPDTVTIYVGNHAPEAQAGEDQVIPANSLVTLDGTASWDLDGDPLSYFWSQISGPPVVLSGMTSPSPTFMAPGAGTMVFELIVNDSFMDSAPDTVIVAVAGAEQCGNGVDDDMDGLVDCEDDDCAQDPQCVPSVTLVAGPSPLFVAALGEQAIPDGTGTMLEVPIEVAGQPLVGDIQVLVEIDHASPAELTVQLVSPQGTTIMLARNPAAVPFGYYDDDDPGPGAPRMVPQMALSALEGQDPNGLWTLRVRDGAAGNGGILRRAALELGPPTGTEADVAFVWQAGGSADRFWLGFDAPPNPEVDPSCDCLTSPWLGITTLDLHTFYVAAGDGRQVTEARRWAWALSVGTAPEVCTNGLDDDGDGLIDCADPDCGSEPACVGDRHRRVITIINRMEEALPEGYPVAVDLDHAAWLGQDPPLSSSSGDDIRVFHEPPAGVPVELNRVADPRRGFGRHDTRVWFPLRVGLNPGETTTAYALYHGGLAPGEPPAEAGLIFQPRVDPQTASLLPFEDLQGSLTAHDTTGRGDGTLTDIPEGAWVEGRHGGGLSLGGGSQRVVLAHTSATELGRELTLEAWVYLRSTAGLGWIISKRQEDTGACTAGLGVRDGILEYSVTSWSLCDPALVARSSVALEINRWYHVAGVFRGSVLSVYIDGEQAGSLAIAEQLAFMSDVPFTVGATDSGLNAVDGVVDGARVSVTARGAFPYGRITTDPSVSLGVAEVAP